MKRVAVAPVWWEFRDGSRVLTFRIPFEYLSWGKELDAHVARCAAEVKAPYTEGMCFYGVGNHGGGPTKQNIESIRRYRPIKRPEIISVLRKPSSTRLPPKKDIELRSSFRPANHAQGCYARPFRIKRWIAGRK